MSGGEAPLPIRAAARLTIPAPVGRFVLYLLKFLSRKERIVFKTSRTLREIFPGSSTQPYSFNSSLLTPNS